MIPTATTIVALAVGLMYGMLIQAYLVSQKRAFIYFDLEKLNGKKKRKKKVKKGKSPKEA